ncbi:MAG TPA: glycosyltransferase family 9 protein [Pyrinomonadaceae bacterium]
MNTQKWRRARNILAVRLDAMGDVLMTGPALRAVKESGAAARRVTLLTSASGAVAARLLPEIDDVIIYDAPWMKASGACDAAADRAMIERLAAEKFDAAVIFTVYSQNPLPAAFLCHMAEIPRRLAHCRENPYRLLTDWAREIEPEQIVRHEVRRQLDLVAGAGCVTADERMRVEISAGALDRVRRILRRSGIDADSRAWIALHAGATAASRRYPPESFARAARILVEKHGMRIVFTGTAEETAVVEEVRAAVGAGDTVSLCGALDFEELAALVSFAPVIVTNNSSPVHLASALETPVVDLYALTNPQHTPWMTPNRVLYHDAACGFCYKSVCPEGHHACLRRVEPERVAAAVSELLDETQTNRHAPVFRAAEILRTVLAAPVRRAAPPCQQEIELC